MWASRVELRVHYATCRGLDSQISDFMSDQHSFDLSTLAAGKLTGMVTAIIEQLGETEDRWDKVADKAKTQTTPRMVLDVIRRSVGARGTMSTNNLPYPTYSADRQ